LKLSEGDEVIKNVWFWEMELIKVFLHALTQLKETKKTLRIKTNIKPL
jgi:hypothetical protein